MSNMFQLKMLFTKLLISLSVFAFVSAVPSTSTRIVGGSLTTISTWPYMASLLYSANGITYSQNCGGTILTNTAVLTAAQCIYGKNINLFRIRAGSSWASSGGYVYSIRLATYYPYFDPNTLNNDIAIMRTTSTIQYVNNAVAPATIAGSSYILGDNQIVWAIGWGATSVGGSSSDQLRQVQIWTVNQSICNNRYYELGLTVTDNMLCSGWLDVGGRDQCQGDSGGPLIHNNVIVGVCSWGHSCAQPRYPGVNTRVSRYTAWIQTTVA